jgi:hypothetical protein
MTDADRKLVEDLAELVVHRYFNNYLTNVFPKQLKAFVDGHQNACPWGTRMKRAMWIGIGISFGLGAGGSIAGERLLRVLGGP